MGKNKDRKHDSVSVSKVLTKQIDELIIQEESTHSTRADFVEDAVRRHIEKTKKDIMEERQHREHLEAMNIK